MNSSENLNVSRETRQRLTEYHDLLVKWQARINLIANSTLDSIWQRHVYDCVQMFNCLAGVRTVIDVGSGAGFPGLVIAIMLAEQGKGSVTMVESNGKKCAFLNAAIRHLDLKSAGLSVRVCNERIEQAMPRLEIANYVTARALAPLDDLLRLTQSHLGSGSVGVFAKGRDHLHEIEVARRNWKFDFEIINSTLQEGSVILKISELKAV